MASTFRFAYDHGAKDLYQVSRYPTSILIDREGMLRLRFHAKRSLEAMVEERLN